MPPRAAPSLLQLSPSPLSTPQAPRVPVPASSRSPIDSVPAYVLCFIFQLRCSNFPDRRVAHALSSFAALSSLGVAVNMRQEAPDSAGKNTQRDRLSVLREDGVRPAENTAQYDAGASLDIAAQRLSSVSESFGRPHQARFRAFYRTLLRLILYNSNMEADSCNVELSRVATIDRAGCRPPYRCASRLKQRRVCSLVFLCSRKVTIAPNSNAFKTHSSRITRIALPHSHRHTQANVSPPTYSAACCLPRTLRPRSPDAGVLHVSAACRRVPSLICSITPNIFTNAIMQATQ
jgi:hypothetical protein